uniref:Peptidase S1 domain-containing protein n=1 Tax=Denticeps clupeoides TaxID=299321 RepID=A0AAY4CDI1_9TELE
VMHGNQAPRFMAFPDLLSAQQHADVSIVNGTVVQIESRPYMVSLQHNRKHRCGGFVVSEDFVMTAAHCLKWGQSLEVLVGASDLSKHKTGKFVTVNVYHIYPGYKKTLENDIALLQLSEKLKFTKSVQPIPIPKKKEDIKAKSVCMVAGWGAKKTNGPVSDLLHQAEVTIVKRDQCNKAWKDITPDMLCTAGGAGFCQGDSGGPLVCKGKAAGVVSFNERNNCHKPNLPNVYTKISAYLKWINIIMTSVKQ